LTAEGESSCLRHLGADTPVLHWHGDTFDLPEGGARLAANETYENQAFALGEAVLALQFHLEVEPARLERWFVGHACEIAATAGVDVPALRRDSRTHGPPLAAAAVKVLAEWLDRGQA
jgi:GMP synthase (glutamine-hydrolysing)